jgi:two-component system, response regulator YesN
LRVMVVDDEHIVIEAVTHIIQQHFEDVELQIAYNGREAMIRFDQFRPQIVMTDIKMPGISGIDLIERIRKIDNHVKIIIVTAHDQFEFAKDAVRYHVEDYLLKPLSKSRMIETLQQVMVKVRDDEASRKQELGNIERFYHSIGLVENNFFNSILLGRNHMKYINHYRTILEMPMTCGHFAVVDFTNYSSRSKTEELNQINHKVSKCAEVLKMDVKQRYDAIVSSPYLNRVMIYCEGVEGIQPFDAQLWIDQVLQKFGLKIRIGLGCIKKIEHISESYAEAMATIKLSDLPVERFDRLHRNNVSLNDFLMGKKSVHDAFVNRSRHFGQILKQFEGLYLNMLDKSHNTELAEAVLVELLVNIAQVFDPKLTGDRHYLTELLHKSPTQKLNGFERIVNEWFALHVKMDGANYNELTYQAIKIIQQSFVEEITLEKTAEILSVSAPYLSKIFKEDTGTTFKEYVIELRMEQAKQLLKRSGQSIRETGERVGYNDTNYFIRAFKKYEGITPKDYQRMRQ